MHELIARFAPGRLHTLPMFHAIPARLLGGFRWTNPYYLEVAVNADGDVVGLFPGGEVARFCPVAELEHNLWDAVNAVGLTEEEKGRIATLITTNIVVPGGHLDAFETLGVSPPNPLLN